MSRHQSGVSAFELNRTKRQLDWLLKQKELRLMLARVWQRQPAQEPVQSAHPRLTPGHHRSGS
jgi:hypothetical protein